MLVAPIVMLGMLVIAPTGPKLADDPVLERIRRLWPLFAVPGAVALWLPRGAAAAPLADCYAPGTMILALRAPRLARTRSANPTEVAPLTGW